MKDDELFDVWNAADKNEKKIFEERQGSYEQLAQRKSKDVFRRLERNMIGEAIIGVVLSILIIVLLLFFVSNDILFWLSFVFVLVINVFGIKLYTKCFLALRNVHESSLTESLKKKISILSRYIAQLNLYNYILQPLGFLLGVYIGFSEANEGEKISIEFSKGAIVIVFLLLMAVFFTWLTKKYIYALYGRHLKTIEEMYEGLVSE